MNQFDGPLIIQYDRDASDQLGADYWRVMRSFRYYLPTSDIANEWTTYDTKRWAFVAAGTLTDLGTVPKTFRGIIDNGGRAAQGFVLHDQLCEYLSITAYGQPEAITRQEGDLILLSALCSLGMPKADAYMIYNSVSAYSEIMGIKSPSTTVAKRALEAKFNFEGF